MAASTPLLSQAFIDRLARLLWSLARPRAGAAERGRAARRPGGIHRFEGHRPYAPGDDPRQIDWSAFARTDHLVVKVFGREEEETVDLLLDRTASMEAGASPTKAEAACRLAAALGFLALHSGHRLRLAPVGEGAVRLRGPYVGVESTGAFLRELEGLGAGSGRDAAGGIRGYLEKVRRPGAVALLSDGLEGPGLAEAVAHLGDAAAESTWFHLLGPEDLRPELVGRMALSDAEGGETLELEIGPQERRFYLHELAAFRRASRELSARHAVDYRPVASVDSLETTVTDWHRGRARR